MTQEELTIRAELVAVDTEIADLYDEMEIMMIEGDCLGYDCLKCAFAGRIRQRNELNRELFELLYP